MIYEYECIKCQKRFDVVKSVKDIDVNEFCVRCGEPSERKFVPSRIHIFGASVENAEYNHGLGQVVRNKKHRAEIAKQKGLIEIGNEKTESIHKELDQVRAKRREKAWDDV